MTLVLPNPVIDATAKSFAPGAFGTRLSDIGALGLRLSDFLTPIASIDVGRLTHNERRYFGWASERGLLLAPHGKTSMAPLLWDRALNAGAWGMTFATPWQALCGFDAGVSRIVLANNVVDPIGIRRLTDAVDADPSRELVVWADSDESVLHLDAVRSGCGATRPWTVHVDVGQPGGRTGARSTDASLEVGRAVGSARTLQLGGVAGFEGILAHGRDPESLGVIDEFLRRVLDVALAFEQAGLFAGCARPMVSVGGSAYPDRVDAALGTLRTRFEILLRSGAAQVHDDGLYTRLSPLRQGATDDPLRAALHVWTRVISAPEEGLVLCDAGKRDTAFDTDYPVPQRTLDGTSIEGNAAVVDLNDQHAYVRGRAQLNIGDIVRMGISHPCVLFDKWRVIPLIADADEPDPRVIGACATLF